MIIYYALSLDVRFTRAIYCYLLLIVGAIGTVLMFPGMGMFCVNILILASKKFADVWCEEYIKDCLMLVAYENLEFETDIESVDTALVSVESDLGSDENGEYTANDRRLLRKLDLLV